MNRSLSSTDLVLETVTQTLVGPKSRIKLQINEFKLLSAFSFTADNILDTGEIAERFDMDDEDFSRSTLTVKIVRLRKKLKQAFGENADIRAVRLKGYKLTTPLKLV